MYMSDGGMRSSVSLGSAIMRWFRSGGAGGGESTCGTAGTLPRLGLALEELISAFNKDKNKIKSCSSYGMLFYSINSARGKADGRARIPISHKPGNELILLSYRPRIATRR